MSTVALFEELPHPVGFLLLAGMQRLALERMRNQSNLF